MQTEVVQQHKVQLAAVDFDLAMAKAKVTALTNYKTQLAALTTTSAEETDTDENETSSPVVTSPKAGQGSKASTKKAAAVVEDDSSDDDLDEVFGDKEEISDADIKAGFAAYAKRNGTDKAKKILKKFGVSNSSQLTQEQRSEAMEQIQ